MKPTEQAQNLNKRILQILQEYSYQNDARSNQRSIIDDDFNDLSDDIVREAISQMQPDWTAINSEVDLPKEQGLYFVTMKKDNAVLTAYFNHQTHTHTWLSAISHWMPIVKPQPPTK